MYAIQVNDIFQNYIPRLTVCSTVHASEEWSLFGQMGNDRGSAFGRIISPLEPMSI